MNVTPNSTQANSSFASQLSRPSFLLGALFFFAGLNAYSFFVRTDYPWRRLTGETRGVLLESTDVQFGFPLNIAFSPGQGLVSGDQWSAFIGNLVCAAVVSIVYAAYFGKQKSKEELQQNDFNKHALRWRWEFRFRLIHMLAITTVTAVLLGMFVHAREPSLRALKLIYLAGPCLIVWVFYVLRNQPRLQVYALIGVSLTLACGAAKFSAEVFEDFTYGLFGIFVCWLPQLLTMIIVLFVSQNLRAAWQAVEQPR